MKTYTIHIRFTKKFKDEQALRLYLKKKLKGLRITLFSWFT